MTKVPVLDNVEVGDYIKVWDARLMTRSFAPAGSDRFENPSSSFGMFGEVMEIDRRPRSYQLVIQSASTRPEVAGGRYRITLPLNAHVDWNHRTEFCDIDGRQVQIDVRIVPLLNAARDFGLSTDFCCEGSLRSPYFDSYGPSVYDSQIMFSSPEEGVRFIRRCQELEVLGYVQDRLQMKVSAHPGTQRLRGEVRFPFQFLPLLTEAWAPGNPNLFDGVDLSWIPGWQ